jgi:hypothetical protein
MNLKMNHEHKIGTQCGVRRAAYPYSDFAWFNYPALPFIPDGKLILRQVERSRSNFPRDKMNTRKSLQ